MVITAYQPGGRGQGGRPGRGLGRGGEVGVLHTHYQTGLLSSSSWRALKGRRAELSPGFEAPVPQNAGFEVMLSW